jgi:hypothetical protein
MAQQDHNDGLPVVPTGDSHTPARPTRIQKPHLPKHGWTMFFMLRQSAHHSLPPIGRGNALKGVR